MALQFFDSPFHVTHDEEVASKNGVEKWSYRYSSLIASKKLGLKQSEAASRLNVTQSRVSELTTGKIEKFTIDAMMDMLDRLGFRTTFTLPSNDAGALPQIVISQSHAC